MSKPFYRFCIFNLCGAALLIWAYLLGYVEQVFRGDVSHISYVISALFLLCVIRAVYAASKQHSVAYLEDVAVWCVTLGLIGNVVGFILALRGIDVSSLGSPEGAQKVAGNLLAGMSVAFYSTLVGAITALWLNMGKRIIG